MRTRAETTLAALLVAAIAALSLAVWATRPDMLPWLDAKIVLTGLAIPGVGFAINYFGFMHRRHDRTAELYKEFAEMMQQRTDAWYRTGDVTEKISPAHKQYVALWTIASFYARLGFLFDANLLDKDLAVSIFAQTFTGWDVVHFYKLGPRHSSEMERIASFRRACAERLPPSLIAKWAAAAKQRDFDLDAFERSEQDPDREASVD